MAPEERLPKVTSADVCTGKCTYTRVRPHTLEHAFPTYNATDLKIKYLQNLIPFKNTFRISVTRKRTGEESGLAFQRDSEFPFL